MHTILSLIHAAHNIQVFYTSYYGLSHIDNMSFGFVDSTDVSCYVCHAIRLAQSQPVERKRRNIQIVSHDRIPKGYGNKTKSIKLKLSRNSH